MANKKLTDLTELTTPADGDFLYIVDVSDTTESAQGTSKKIRKDKVDSGASKENIANKQNSLAIDGTGTKYPTVDAVNAGLPVNYSKIVYVNATSPITATIFDTENPPVTNNNALKNDTANLYIGTDASTWVYLTGTGYVTKTISSATSNFYLAGTTTDAGGSKIAHITRSGLASFLGNVGFGTSSSLTSKITIKGSGSSNSTFNTRIFNSSNSLILYIDDNGGLTSENFLKGRDVTATRSFSVSDNTGFIRNIGSPNTSYFVFKNGDYWLSDIKLKYNSDLSASYDARTLVDKGYADAKITQTITNGVTDKSPSEDAVFYAIEGVVNNIPFNIIGDDIENNNTGRVLIGDGTHTVDDSAVLINRDLTTGGTSLGFHAIRDETLYNTNDVTGLRAYASFDAIPKMQGTALFNHLHSFQSRPNYSGSSLISALRGFTHQPTITGPVDLHQAIFIDDFLGAGTVNQNVGLYIKPLLKGVSNYAIFSEGIAPSFFGGTLQTNGLVQGATAKFTSYSGTFGSFTTFDSSGNLMNNPNLTLINGVLSMKFSTARIKSTVTALELESLTNLIFLTAGTEKARIATNGNFLLGSSADNGASDKLQVTGTLATTSTIKAGATVRLKNYTVATLPAGVQGDTAYVTDALAPTYLGALVGGGAVVCPVFFNGTAWVSH